MPDQFTTVTRTGYGTRIMNSLKGIVTGFVLFIASFGVLFWNEGRVDLANVAKKAVQVSSTEIASDHEGEFISSTGTVSSTEKISDHLFLNADTYIAVKRSVEMYAWVEDQEKKTKENLGGSETTETTYTYTKKWTGSPAATSSFEHPEGHENPSLSLKDSTTYASTATLGVYSFDPETITLSGFDTVMLSDSNTTPSGTGVRANDTYMFVPATTGSTIGNPAVGDVRVSYSAVRPGFDGTIFGQLDSNGVITSYTNDDGDSVYRVFEGTRAEALKTLHDEHTMTTWILRVVGFMMMWMGLAALFGPISVFLAVVPFLGALSRSVVGLITFVVAFILSIITILLSMILHNIVALLITAVIVVAGVIVGVKMIKARGMKTPPAAPTPAV